MQATGRILHLLGDRYRWKGRFQVELTTAEKRNRTKEKEIQTYQTWARTAICVLCLGIAASALDLPATETVAVTVTVTLTAKNILPPHPWLSQMALVMNFRIMPGRTGLSYISRGKKIMETF